MSLFSIFYRCSFCRLSLRAIPFSQLKVVPRIWALLGMRVYQCPHCFECSYRPGLPFLCKTRDEPSEEVSPASRKKTPEAVPPMATVGSHEASNSY